MNWAGGYHLYSFAIKKAEGRSMGDNEQLQTDPHFKNYVLFHEYFHGDTGRGLGASHQTGWTGLIAKLLQPKRREEPAMPLKAADSGKKPNQSFS